MKKVLIMPILAAALFIACDGSDPITPPVPPTVVPTASLRFFNATTGMAGSGGFMTNGQFATGSALAFGQSTQTCSTVNADATSFGFGAANTAGTGLSGNALATLNNQIITADGKFTVVATGSAASATLFLLNDSYSGSLGANQAAVRFVNLAPGTGSTANTFVVYRGMVESGQPPVHISIVTGAPTSFRNVSSGPNTFSILQNPGHNIVISGSVLTLQEGSVNTVAIVPGTSGGFQLINIPRC